jgi:hypothetical protein
MALNRTLKRIQGGSEMRVGHAEVSLIPFSPFYSRLPPPLMLICVLVRVKFEGVTRIWSRLGQIDSKNILLENHTTSDGSTQDT